MPTDDDGINSSNSKENSVQLIGSSYWFRIYRFSGGANAELLPEETRLTNVEQNWIVVGSAVCISEASLTLNRNQSESTDIDVNESDFHM